MLETAQISALSFPLLSFKQPQRFGHRQGADAIVERAGNRQVAAQHFEFIDERDRVADLHEFLGFLAAAARRCR